MPAISFTMELTFGHLVILAVTALGFWFTRRAFGRLDARLHTLEREIVHRT